MFLIFISCIIISNFSRRKIAVEATFLIQKLLNFNIFLLFSKITLKIINLLNLLIFTIFLRAINVFSMFNLYIRTIIFAAFIFCTHFISYSFLIYIINFFLFDFRFEKTLISRRKNVEVAIVDCLIIFLLKYFLQSCLSSFRSFFSIF